MATKKSKNDFRVGDIVIWKGTSKNETATVLDHHCYLGEAEPCGLMCFFHDLGDTSWDRYDLFELHPISRSPLFEALK
jgi:hypothetical protein